MNTTFPPTPFPRKGVTTVQPLRGFRFIDSLFSWGGSSEATS
jgi:hypothetical protein